MISGKSEPREAITKPMVKVLKPIIVASLMSWSTARSLATISINPPAKSPRIACQINIELSKSRTKEKGLLKTSKNHSLWIRAVKNQTMHNK